MKSHPIRTIVVVLGVGALGAGGMACELAVQLDRSFVDAGDAGCPICSDAAEEADEDSAVDAQSTETNADATGTDASAETSPTDSSATE